MLLQEDASRSNDVLSHWAFRISGCDARTFATVEGPLISGCTTSLTIRGMDPLYRTATSMALSRRPACRTLWPLAVRNSQVTRRKGSSSSNRCTISVSRGCAVRIDPARSSIRPHQATQHAAHSARHPPGPSSAIQFSGPPSVPDSDVSAFEPPAPSQASNFPKWNVTKAHRLPVRTCPAGICKRRFGLPTLEIPPRCGRPVP